MLDVWANARLVAIEPTLFHRHMWVHSAARMVVRTLLRETRHDNSSTYRHSALSHGGRGPPHAPFGLIWSAFRPSDDPVEASYSIPSNVFAAVQARPRHPSPCHYI